MKEDSFCSTVDKFVMRMFKKLYDELYFSHTMVYSSNKPYTGKNILFENYGGNTKIQFLYKLWKTTEEIKIEREIIKKKFQMVSLFSP